MSNAHAVKSHPATAAEYLAQCERHVAEALASHDAQVLAQRLRTLKDAQAL